MFINYMVKFVYWGVLNSFVKVVCDMFIIQCVQILVCYRKNCVSFFFVGQLIFFECMKLFLVYLNCVLKSDVLQFGVEVIIDDCVYV